jgi:pimeloyl-ACP methyl ester carboxylesterase
VVVIPNAEYMFDDFKYARLVTIENAAHLPWIESPEKVSRSIQIFLDGGWPNS